MRTPCAVIEHITNAILTFEPLQIRSNLSGGPQQRTKRKDKKKEDVALLRLPY